MFSVFLMVVVLSTFPFGAGTETTAAVDGRRVERLARAIRSLPQEDVEILGRAAEIMESVAKEL